MSIPLAACPTCKNMLLPNATKCQWCESEVQPVTSATPDLPDNSGAGGMVFISLVLTGMQILYLLFSAYTCKGGCAALSLGHLIPAGIVMATWFSIRVSYRTAKANSKLFFALLLAPSVGVSFIASVLLITTFVEGIVGSISTLLSGVVR